LAQWIQDAYDDGFTSLRAFGVNDIDWWLDAERLGRHATRRYALDSDSELEALLLCWPAALRTTVTQMSIEGHVTAGDP
jgi:hypothetical protein